MCLNFMFAAAGVNHKSLTFSSRGLRVLSVQAVCWKNSPISRLQVCTWKWMGWNTHSFPLLGAFNKGVFYSFRECTASTRFASCGNRHKTFWLRFDIADFVPSTGFMSRLPGVFDRSSGPNFGPGDRCGDRCFRRTGGDLWGGNVTLVKEELTSKILEKCDLFKLMVYIIIIKNLRNL